MSTTPNWQDALDALEALGLTEADIAKATGVARPTMRSWGAGLPHNRADAHARMVDLVRVLTRLSQLFPDGYLAEWIQKSIPALDDRTPLEVLATGDFWPLWGVVEMIEEGYFS